MKGLGFVVAVVLALIIFGLPIMVCFVALLVVGVGLSVDSSFPCGMILAIAMIVGIAIKVFFVDE